MFETALFGALASVLSPVLFLGALCCISFRSWYRTTRKWRPRRPRDKKRSSGTVLVWATLLGVVGTLTSEYWLQHNPPSAFETQEPSTPLPESAPLPFENLACDAHEIPRDEGEETLTSVATLSSKDELRFAYAYGLTASARKAMNKKAPFCAKGKAIAGNKCDGCKKAVDAHCYERNQLHCELLELAIYSQDKAFALGLRAEAELRIKRLNSIHIETPNEERTFRWIGIFVFLLFNIGGGWGLVRHARICGIDLLGRHASQLIVPYIVLIVFVITTNIVNTLPIEAFNIRDGLDWASACFDPKIWTLDKVSRLLLGLSHSAAMAPLWVLGSPLVYPPPLKSQHDDEMWGQQKFITLLGTWSVLTAVFMVVPAFGWAAMQGREDNSSVRFVLPWFLIILVSFFAIIRLALQGSRVRARYRIRRKKFSKDVRADLPSDPTLNLLGPHGFKYVQTALVVLTLLWALIEWSGGSRALPLTQ